MYAPSFIRNCQLVRLTYPLDLSFAVTGLAKTARVNSLFFVKSN